MTKLLASVPHNQKWNTFFLMLIGLLFLLYNNLLWSSDKQPDSIMPNTLIQTADFYCNAQQHQTHKHMKLQYFLNNNRRTVRYNEIFHKEKKGK